MDGRDVNGMFVCRACAELRGEVALEDGMLVTQRCRCGGRRTGDPVWPWHDFNCVAELCHVCARAVIPSGSKWSSFFCDVCRARVVALNRSAGRCVIPIGRHSILNGAFIGGERPATDENIRRFVVDLRDTFERMRHLDAWRSRRVQRAMQAIGQDDDVPLERYLSEARSVLPTSANAYDELLESWASP